MKLENPIPKCLESGMLSVRKPSELQWSMQTTMFRRVRSDHWGSLLYWGSDQIPDVPTMAVNERSAC